MVVNVLLETTQVESFNTRTGAVMPQKGDYTAEMVGAMAADAIVPTSQGGTGLSVPLFTAGTADLVAGSTRGTAGTMYFVYKT